MEKTGLFYVRFMDDIVVLAPTRWKRRKAVALLNQELNALALEKHPDKTFIGRIDKGFDFLGFHISPTTVFSATHTVQQYRVNRARLYEQGASPRRIEHYQHRWRGWVKGMLGDYMSPSAVKQYVDSTYGPVQMFVPGNASSST